MKILKLSKKQKTSDNNEFLRLNFEHWYHKINFQLSEYRKEDIKTFKKKVRFSTFNTETHLPIDEALAAKEARFYNWEEAPYEDNIWDGLNQTFRETELTIVEMKELISNIETQANTNISFKRSIEKETSKLKDILIWMKRTNETDIINEELVSDVVLNQQKNKPLSFKEELTTSIELKQTKTNNLTYKSQANL